KFESVRIEIQVFFTVFIEIFEKRFVPYYAVFDHLGHSSKEFLLRQRLEHIYVHENLFRLIEGADHVFTQRMVHTGLATHAAVHHGKKCGGYFNKWNTAHERRRGKPRKVADH